VVGKLNGEDWSADTEGDMAASSNNGKRLYVVRWMVAGALIGTFFTLMTWRLVVGDAGSVTYAELHDAYPTLWMVDLAPSVLGISGAVIGVLFTRLADSKERIEAAAREISAGWISELHATNVELAEALESRGRFHAAVTHELRTPLATILGFTDLAEGVAAESPDMAGYISEIAGAATAMQHLVNDLLDAAKLESNGIPIEIGFVPCEAVIRDVVGRLKPLAWQKGLEIAIDVAEGVACRADPLRLRQILSNLVANAIKYSEAGTIHVSAFKQMNGAPVIAVKDEGIGIRSEDLGRIFSAFQSGENGASRGDSSGLGLAISKSLAKAMDGALTVHSEGPGQGSTFRLTLRAPNHQGVEKRVAHLTPGRAVD
jgi:signal transduction histidine kinase